MCRPGFPRGNAGDCGCGQVRVEPDSQAGGRYEPTARAMQAALPFIDRLAPAHNLESLERLVPELAQA